MPRLVPISKQDEWFTGKDKVFSYVVLDFDDEPEDITGWALAWRLFDKGAAAGAVARIEKTTSSGITIQTVAKSTLVSQLAARWSIGADITDGWASTVKVAEVAIADTDTDALPGAEYYSELVRTDAGSEDVIAYGPAWLLPSPTR